MQKLRARETHSRSDFEVVTSDTPVFVLRSTAYEDKERAG
jgi:hypothetical protein